MLFFAHIFQGSNTSLFMYSIHISQTKKNSNKAFAWTNSPILYPKFSEDISFLCELKMIRHFFFGTLYVEFETL